MHDRRVAPDVRGLEADAYAQGGYFDMSQAHAHGVSRQLLDHYVRQGRFERVRRGLYHLHGFPSAENDQMREKWMAVGTDKAVLSNQSALALLELSDVIPGAVHLLVPRRHRGLRRPHGVIIHTRPDDETPAIVWRDGLPLTAPAQTLIDVAGELQPEQLVLAVEQALRQGLVTPRQLRSEAARRHRTADLEQALHRTQRK
ncbi:MAG: type IV toxin-antitoxin system AbiEi family antitoxin domain-containing protein [Candidatus Dormibacteria bacterium]